MIDPTTCHHDRLAPIWDAAATRVVGAYCDDCAAPVLPAREPIHEVSAAAGAPHCGNCAAWLAQDDPYVQRIAEWELACGMTLPWAPTLFDKAKQVLRVRLLREEVDELEAAFWAGDIVEVADALGDIDYLTQGAAVLQGIPLYEVFCEIHRSNMTKVSGGVVIKRDDGKILKPSSYEAPDLLSVLARHQPHA